jgi:hypothetical protein
MQPHDEKCSILVLIGKGSKIQTKDRNRSESKGNNNALCITIPPRDRDGEPKKKTFLGNQSLLVPLIQTERHP